MKRIGTYIEGLDQLRQGEIVLAEHLQRLELLIIRPILKFQGNHIIASSIFGQLESNRGSIVSCEQL